MVYFELQIKKLTQIIQINWQPLSSLVEGTCYDFIEGKVFYFYVFIFLLLSFEGMF